MPSESDISYPARFTDGQSAGQLAVSIRPTAEGLAIVSDDGVEMGVWDWAHIHQLEKATAGRPIRLGNRTIGGARLTVDDHAILPTLEDRTPHLHRDPLTQERVKAMTAFGGTIAAMIAFAIWGIPLLAGPIAQFVPISWEERVGDDTVNVVNKLLAGGKKMCAEPKGQEILEKLTAKLIGETDTPYDIRVSVANGKIVNAFAVPGGRVVLFRGLIEKAKTPDEVAGVLAHELAHVVHRHPTQGLVASVGWSMLLSVFSGGAAISNEALARLAGHMATSAYSRDLEAEADSTGVDMLQQADIGSRGLIDFFRSLQSLEEKGIKLPEYLSSHPVTSKRIKAIEGKSRSAQSPALTEQDWKILRKICG
jgi:predicted Zn-dependent protease